MNIHSFSLKIENDKTVSGDIYYNGLEDQPIIIISHGFKAYRKWGFFPYMAEQYANQNMIVINFDFSLNGVVDPEKGLFDVEKFRTITVSQEIADLNSVIENLRTIITNNNIDGWNGEIYLMGHSLGGAISIITASKRSDITKVVTWGSIGDIDRNTERQKKDWREKGVLEFENRITGQKLSLDVEYLEDKLRNKEDYDLEKCIAGLNIPVLIVHGIMDFTVRLKEAQLLHNAAKDSTLVLIEKANHTFNCRHPFAESNEYLDEAINSTINFLNN